MMTMTMIKMVVRMCVLTDLSVISFHISPALLLSSVIEIPGNFSFICDLFSFSQIKYAD